MVHKWLLRKAREKILTGLILLFIVGPLFFVYTLNMRLWTVERHHPSMDQALLFEIQHYSPRLVGSAIGRIGILFLIFGIGYLLVTIILENMKKRRYAHRSNTYE